jgi:hypothetical protein
MRNRLSRRQSLYFCFVWTRPDQHSRLSFPRGDGWDSTGGLTAASEVTRLLCGLRQIRSTGSSATVASSEQVLTAVTGVILNCSSSGNALSSLESSLLRNVFDTNAETPDGYTVLDGCSASQLFCLSIGFVTETENPKFTEIRTKLVASPKHKQK